MSDSDPVLELPCIAFLSLCIRTHAGDARCHQLARLACGLHVASLLSCVGVVYLYLTTSKRRRTRTSKLLFFLSLCSAALALSTALTEWAAAEACLGVLRCHREPTRLMALMESARILCLHTCGAWTGCIAVHFIREHLLSHGFVSYDFAKAQKYYYLAGWGAPLVHMQLCIALKSAMGPRAASAMFVGFDIVVLVLVALAFIHAMLPALAAPRLCCIYCRRLFSPRTGSSARGARSISLSTHGETETCEHLPGLRSARERSSHEEFRARNLLALAPHLCAHAWKVDLTLTILPAATLFRSG